MELELNETQALIQKTARDFATRVIAPQAAEHRRDGAIPAARSCAASAELGLMAVNVPPELGRRRGRRGRVRARDAGDRARLRVDGGDDERHQHGRRGHRALRHRRAEGSATAPGSQAASTPSGSFALSEPDAGSDPGGDAHDRAARRRRLGPRRRQAVDHRRRARGRLHRVGAHRRRPRRAPAASRASSSRGAPRAAASGRPEDKLGIRASNTVAARVRRLPRPERRASRAGERRLQDRDDGARRRAHRDQLAGHRHRAGGARRERRVREGAARVRRAHRRATRPSSGSSPTCRRSIDAAHLLCRCARPGSKRRGSPSRARPRWRRSSPARRPSASATTPCRSTAATATRASCPPSATCATRASRRFTRARARSSAIVIARSVLG